MARTDKSLARAEKTLPNFYRDSVALMQLSSRIEGFPGITRATAVMATQANIDLLKEAGFTASDLSPRPNDLLIVIEGHDDAAVADALSQTEAALQAAAAPAAGTAAGPAAIPAASLAMALEDKPAANFALISTPGEYAAAEAEKALRLGLNVMVFSANVAPGDEIALKRMARERQLLMMGPDCGTAIVNGVPLGFANALQRGPVGLVGSAGTGLQEVTSLLDRAGIGVSQVLGCGARDLSDDVQGLSMRQGLAALAGDDPTRVIVLVAKHPSIAVARRIGREAAQLGKPVVLAFLGLDLAGIAGGNIFVAGTLDDAARTAAALALGKTPPTPAGRDPALAALARENAGRLSERQAYIRALYSGGTFCYEAQTLLAQEVAPIWSNTPIAAASTLPDVWTSREHTLIDLGDEFFTRGRPHPMIDLRLRLERLRQEFADPQTAVILLDVVLGYGAHADPATEIASAIADARAGRPPTDHDVIVVASVCGTQADPQGLSRQEEALRQAGVLLAPSNAAAARLAARIIHAHSNRAGHT